LDRLGQVALKDIELATGIVNGRLRQGALGAGRNSL
jgi:hypothetical protein